MSRYYNEEVHNANSFCLNEPKLIKLCKIFSCLWSFQCRKIWIRAKNRTLTQFEPRKLGFQVSSILANTWSPSWKLIKHDPIVLLRMISAVLGQRLRKNLTNLKKVKFGSETPTLSFFAIINLSFLPNTQSSLGWF